MKTCKTCKHEKDIKMVDDGNPLEANTYKIPHCWLDEYDREEVATGECANYEKEHKHG